MSHKARTTFVALAVLAGLALAAPGAKADVVTVSSLADIMGAGYGGSPGGAGAAVAISLAPGATSVTFSSVTGLITLNSGGNYNNADGGGAAVSSAYNSGYGSLSAITTSGAGDLLGVFELGGTPVGGAPSAFSYSASATSFSPVINQVFFIGDGYTGTGTGVLQTFYVPTGATVLYLGIADACGYNGFSSCWGDNAGSYTVTYNVSAPVPAPMALLLIGTGLVGLSRLRRRS